MAEIEINATVAGDRGLFPYQKPVFYIHFSFFDNLVLKFTGYGYGQRLTQDEAKELCALSIVQQLYTAGLLDKFHPDPMQLDEEKKKVKNASPKINGKVRKISHQLNNEYAHNAQLKFYHITHMIGDVAGILSLRGKSWLLDFSSKMEFLKN